MNVARTTLVLVLLSCGSNTQGTMPGGCFRTQTGKASYYSDKLHGRRTASGATYDKRALSAAHRELPFGTMVRVTRTDTGKSVRVTINDRGPFRDHRRVVDLSRAAAESLHMVRRGVVDITLEVERCGR